MKSFFRERKATPGGIARDKNGSTTTEDLSLWQLSAAQLPSFAFTHVQWHKGLKRWLFLLLLLLEWMQKVHGADAPTFSVHVYSFFRVVPSKRTIFILYTGVDGVGVCQSRPVPVDVSVLPPPALSGVCLLSLASTHGFPLVADCPAAAGWTPPGPPAGAG